VIQKSSQFQALFMTLEQNISKKRPKSQICFKALLMTIRTITYLTILSLFQALS